MTPGAYNNNVQIVQSPGIVVIVNEMVHNARIIPTDGRPHTTLRQWSGDSRGRWEGDTLVVETINFRRETSLQGSTADTRLVERFTRVDADTIKYEFTVTDPNSYTRPWSAMVPLVENPRAALRVRLPRGQLRAAEHSRRRARAGEGASRSAAKQAGRFASGRVAVTSRVRVRAFVQASRIASAFSRLPTCRAPDRRPSDALVRARCSLSSSCPATEVGRAGRRGEARRPHPARRTRPGCRRRRPAPARS